MRIWCLISDIDFYVEKFGKALLGQKEDGYELVVLDYASVEIRTGDATPSFYCMGERLELPDAFWVWTTNTDTRVIENLLLECGAESIVNLHEQDMTRSKIATYHRLAAADVPIPRTFVFFDHVERDEIVSQFSYPFVIKPDNGSSGQGVALIHDDAELDDYLAQLSPSVAYMAQEYVATSRGRDLRVVMLHGEYFMSFVRQSTNAQEFRSNLHLGGEIVPFEPDEQTKELCRKVAGLFDLPVVGLDLMFADDGFILTEVNSYPGLHREDRDRFVRSVIADYLRKRGGEE